MSDVPASVRFDEYVSTNTEPISGSNMTEIDSLYFAELSYCKFEGDEYTKFHIDSKGLIYDGMPLREYAEVLLAAQIETEPSKVAMLNAIASSERYSECSISMPEAKFCPGNCTNKNCVDGVQWAAITIEFNDKDNTSVIAYRGTDGTEQGWLEDFEMAYSPQTDAQHLSADYLARYAAENPDANIILTGHSKGGNDAIYAYLANEESVRNQVDHVYNFDGPGVLIENVSSYSEAYAELDNGKLDSYIPQDSVIGRLLQDHPGNVHFVYSDGIMQVIDTEVGSETYGQVIDHVIPILGEHDAFSWYVTEDGSFRQAEETPLSSFLNNVLDDTVNSLTLKERTAVVSFFNELGIFAMIAGEDSDKSLASDAGLFDKIKAAVNDYNQLSPKEKQAFIDFVAVACFSAEYRDGLELGAETLHEVVNDTSDKAKSKVSSFFDKLYDGCDRAAALSYQSYSTPYANADLVTMANTTAATAVALKVCFAAFEEVCTGVINGITEIANAAIDFLVNALQPSKSSASYSREKVDIDLAVMKQAVADLEAAQKKIAGLDGKLDNLRKKLSWWEVCDKNTVAAVDYTMTGSTVVQNIAEHCLNGGYDWELSSCIRYLNAAITKMEQTEDDLIAKSGVK